MKLPTTDETEHLVSARAGSPEAFNSLVEPYRRPLIVHCYRMSGSLDDAEDLVQETMLRAWRKVGSFRGQGSFRNWLYVIATRLWLDEVRKRKKQVLLPLDGLPADPNSPPRPPTSPTPWLDPLPDSWLASADPSAEDSYKLRESVSLAFMVALQKLNPRQRVVLILRTVFSWSAEEVADVLELTVPAVHNLLYRARKNLQAAQYQEVPAPKQDLDQFVKAWEAGDVPALIGLLHDKATFAMPPMGVWYAGRAAIGQALENFVFQPGAVWKLAPTSANGRPAYALYQRAGDSPDFQAFGLILPVYGEGALIEITAFLNPGLVPRFSLPETVAA